MKKEEAFIKQISKELKQIKEQMRNLQYILAQKDLNFVKPNTKKKKLLRPFRPKMAIQTKHYPQTATDTERSQANAPEIKANHIFFRVEPYETLKDKAEAQQTQMKTVSTFNTTRSINPRLPSAIQARKKEEYARLPYTIKRFNRNYHIANNQLIFQPLLTDIYDETQSTERFLSNAYSVSRNSTPHKVQDYFFHKSLKLRGKKLFSQGPTNPLACETRSHCNEIKEMQITHLNYHHMK